MGASVVIGGVVRGSESPAKDLSPAGPKSTATRPWLNVNDLPVPWKQRAFCFDLKKGHVKMLDQEWDIKRDKDGTPLAAKATGPAHNPHRYPELSFDESEAVYSASEKGDESLKRSFARLYAKRLTEDQKRQLALAPDLYSQTAAIAAKVEREADQASVDKFWKDLGL